MPEPNDRLSDENQPLSPKQMLVRLGALTGVGLEMGAVVIAAYFVGDWLDERWGTGQVLTIVCVTIGMLGAFTLVYRAVRSLMFRK